MESEDQSIVSYKEAESEEQQVVLSPEFTASALIDALHDSPHQLAHVTRCFPGTHTIGKQRLSAWLRNCSSRNSHPNSLDILWTHGPAGTGKTTLMQTLAAALLAPAASSSGLESAPPSYEADGFDTAGVQYGGAALFFSNQDKITNAIRFFTTLAYGLALRLPPLSGFIQSAFVANQHVIQDLSLKDQAKILILDPINAWVASEDGDVDVDFVIIIDGFDNCGDSASKTKQTEIVEAIRDVFTKRTEGVRWLWIFSSRTSARLHEVFVGHGPSVVPRAQELELELAGDVEMSAFVDGALADIRQSHPALRNSQEAEAGSEFDPQPPQDEEEWPSAGDIASIKWHSGGLYAAASSIFEYITNPTSDPRARVSLIDTFVGSSMRFQQGSDHPFTKLDGMYKDILAQVPNDSQAAVQRVLGAISFLQPSAHTQRPPTTVELSDLLDMEAAEIHDLLSDLHSVIRAPPTCVPVSFRAFALPTRDIELSFHHPSFDQFLRTPARSLEWSLNAESVHADLAICCLKRLGKSFMGGGLAGKLPRERWYVHCWRTGDNIEAALGLLPELFDFDFSVLTLNGNAIVDRWFVEWLIHLQDTTMSEYQLLNLGPFVQLRARPELDIELDLDPGSSTSADASGDTAEQETKKLPARQSYILGLEPSKQVYLVPYYDVKVQWRTDLGQVIGPREKYWDWIRGFRVVEKDYAERNIDDSDALRLSGILGSEMGVEELRELLRFQGPEEGDDIDVAMALSLSMAEAEGPVEAGRPRGGAGDDNEGLYA